MDYEQIPAGVTLILIKDLSLLNYEHFCGMWNDNCNCSRPCIFSPTAYKNQKRIRRIRIDECIYDPAVIKRNMQSINRPDKTVW